MSDEAVVEALIKYMPAWDDLGHTMLLPHELDEFAWMILEALRAEGWDVVHTTNHYVDIDPDGWAIQHATYCRPNMLDCEFTKTAKRWESAPAEVGRYLALLDGPNLPLKLVPVPTSDAQDPADA